MARPRSKETAENFEHAIRKLEEIVRRLEEEEISLEASLKLYEEGLRLQRACESRLATAENRVKQLLEDGEGEIAEQDFEPATDETVGGESPEADPDASDDAASSPPPKSRDDLPF